MYALRIHDVWWRLGGDLLHAAVLRHHIPHVFVVDQGRRRVEFFARSVPKSYPNPGVFWLLVASEQHELLPFEFGILISGILLPLELAFCRTPWARELGWDPWNWKFIEHLELASSAVTFCCTASPAGKVTELPCTWGVVADHRVTAGVRGSVRYLLVRR